MSNISSIDWQTWTNEQLDPIAKQLLMNRKTEWVLPFMLAFYADLTLFGVALCQFAKWVRYCHKYERKVDRALVWYIALVCFAIGIYVIAWTYEDFVANFKRYHQFLRSPYASWSYLLDALVRAPVMLWFTHRAWKAKHVKLWLAIPLALVSCVVLAGGINAKILYGINDPTRPLFRTMVTVWLSIYAVASVVLTGSIGYGLLRETEWKGKQRRVERAMLMVAETLLPNCLMAIIFWILFAANPNTKYLVLSICSAKVYMICLLVVCRAKYEVVRSASQNETYNAYSLQDRKSMGGVRVRTETFRVGSEDYDQSAEHDGHIEQKDDDLESRPSQIGDRDRSLRSLNEVEYGSNPSQIQLASPKPVDA